MGLPALAVRLQVALTAVQVRQAEDHQVRPAGAICRVSLRDLPAAVQAVLRVVLRVAPAAAPVAQRVPVAVRTVARRAVVLSQRLDYPASVALQALQAFLRHRQVVLLAVAVRVERMAVKAAAGVRAVAARARASLLAPAAALVARRGGSQVVVDKAVRAAPAARVVVRPAAAVLAPTVAAQEMRRAAAVTDRATDLVR